MDVDATSVPDVSAVMFGLPGFRVLAAGVVGGELELLVETTATSVACPACARPASSHARREHMLRDLAHGDRPVYVLWCKRIWRCRNVDCPKGTWSERSELAAAKASLTGRTRAWAARQVGEHADTVAATARALGASQAHTDKRFGLPPLDLLNVAEQRGITVLPSGHGARCAAGRHRRRRWRWRSTAAASARTKRRPDRHQLQERPGVRPGQRPARSVGHP